MGFAELDRLFEGHSVEFQLGCARGELGGDSQVEMGCFDEYRLAGAVRQEIAYRAAAVGIMGAKDVEFALGPTRDVPLRLAGCHGTDLSQIAMSDPLPSLSSGAEGWSWLPLDSLFLFLSLLVGSSRVHKSTGRKCHCSIWVGECARIASPARDDTQNKNPFEIAQAQCGSFLILKGFRIRKLEHRRNAGVFGHQHVLRGGIACALGRVSMRSRAGQRAVSGVGTQVSVWFGALSEVARVGILIQWLIQLSSEIVSVEGPVG